MTDSTTAIFANGVNTTTYSITYRTIFTYGEAMEELVFSQSDNSLSVLYYTILSDKVTAPEIERPAPLHNGDREHPKTREQYRPHKGLDI